MVAIREKLKSALEHVSVLSDDARGAIAERLEEWLNSSGRRVQETVRERGFLVMARIADDALELFIEKPAFQIDDPPTNQLPGRPNTGPSVLEADPRFEELQIPLSELLSE